jgi:hypothetical protein
MAAVASTSAHEEQRQAIKEVIAKNLYDPLILPQLEAYVSYQVRRNNRH